MNDNSTASVDEILDMELDDLEDMPEFKPFPIGVHRAMISMEQKEINDKQCIEVSLKAKETLELTNSSDEPLKEGDETNILCFLDNEYGRANLKTIAGFFKEFAGTGNVRAVIDAVKDVECLVATGIRHSKKTDTDYTDIKEIKIV